MHRVYCACFLAPLGVGCLSPGGDPILTGVVGELTEVLTSGPSSGAGATTGGGTSASATSAATAGATTTATTGTVSGDTSGALTDTDAAASSTGAPAVCGDQVVEAREECDDGDDEETDACVACKDATCGDNFVWAGVEECDDGNWVQDDACSKSCQLPRYVFITQFAWTGNLGGTTGADMKCAGEAAKNPMLMGRTFRAWISTPTSSPASSFKHDLLGVYHLVCPNKSIVALNGWTTFSSGALGEAISCDHSGAPIGDIYPWTATSDTGAFSGENCNNWTSSSAAMNGIVGSPAKDVGWSFHQARPCDTERRLYCVEQ